MSEGSIPNKIDSPPEEKHNIILVKEDLHGDLTQMQIEDYRGHRHDLAQWTLNVGKDPKTATGYAWSTARRRLDQLDRFYRWLWDEEGKYTTRVTADHGEQYLKEMGYRDVSDSHRANAQKSLIMYYRFREIEFDPDVNYTGSYADLKSREYLTNEERAAVREAVLEYESVPSYDHLTASERREWERHLAQRFQKPMATIDRDDFDRANSFKIPSLVHTALDAGLRPIEVGRAKTHWVDVDNERLSIPSTEDSKGGDAWQPVLRTQTVRLLSQWMEERDCYEKYADTDALWLNRESNPYNSDSLGRLIRQLCDAVGIDTEYREMSWYSIRRSSATYMTREEGIVAAAEQMRNSPKTMVKYDQAPEKERREALDRMG